MKTYILLMPTNTLSTDQISFNVDLCTQQVMQCFAADSKKTRVVPYFIPRTVLPFAVTISNSLALRAQMKQLNPIIDLISANNQPVIFAPGCKHTALGSVLLQICSMFAVDTVELPPVEGYVEPTREFTQCEIESE